MLEENNEDQAGEALKPAEETAVAFEHVQFSYEPGKPVIQDFSLTVPSGKKVALVGATGCGKTTIVNLLMRFYDIDSGRIRINSQDIQKVGRGSLRHNIAIVLRQLGHGSVLQYGGGEPEVRQRGRHQRAAGESGGDEPL